MKKKWFKRLLIISTIILGLKLYLEVDVYLFETKLNIMAIDLPEKFEHKTLDANGHTIHYYNYHNPNKPVLVFLHAAFADHSMYKFQMNYFSKDYSIIAIDLLGHGKSAVGKSNDKIDQSYEHINSILEVENYEKAHLIGVSMGSYIAQYFALKYPNKTQSIITAGAYDINKGDMQSSNEKRTFLFKALSRALFSMRSFRKYSAKQAGYLEKTQTILYQSMQGFTRRSFTVMHGLNEIVKVRKVAPPQFPILIIVGIHDLDIAVNLSKKWHQDLNTSTFKLIKNAGHCVNLDQPDDFNKTVEGFLNQF